MPAGPGSPASRPRTSPATPEASSGPATPAAASSGPATSEPTTSESRSSAGAAAPPTSATAPRLAAAFAAARGAGRCALIPFITAGDPSLAASRDIALALAETGADILELGVPFSDPVADGPVIQRSSERALARGATLADVLALAAEIRRAAGIGVVLFGYYNPVLRYGLERFAADAAEAGVDGVLTTDMTPEEAGEYRPALLARGLAPIFLAAPTSSDARLAAIGAAGEGFLYAVSRTGVTGARDQVPAGARALVERLRRHTQLPIALGFGLSDRRQIAEVAGYADGAVVGTALVAAIHAAVERGGEAAAAPAAGAFLRSLAGTQMRS